jgi:hypothetical protein
MIYWLLGTQTLSPGAILSVTKKHYYQRSAWYIPRDWSREFIQLDTRNEKAKINLGFTQVKIGLAVSLYSDPRYLLRYKKPLLF